MPRRLPGVMHTASPQPAITAVIVTFQSEDWIGRCLTSLFLPPLAPAEVIVVDNASTDRTVDIVRASTHSTRLLTMDRNRGFAAAANAGASVASGEFLLFFNPDAEMLPGSLDALAQYMNRHPEAAVAGPRFVAPDGSPQDGAFSYPTLLMTWLEFFHRPARLLNTRWNGRLTSSDGHPILVDHPLGACMLVRKTAWSEAGPLDERFFLYCEEVDWCMRARKHGWVITHVPSAVVAHQGGASAAAARAESLAHLYASRRYLHRKHRPPLYRVADAFITHLGLAHERKRLIRILAKDPSDDNAERLRGIELALAAKRR
jgi:N-acetylglucosaminyl-diphospho-decaprenol L-rhamnosyltransferase